ncbi:AAA family ATPase [Streptomyces sp. NBC_00893]|uniref:phosphotransferase-like protein n=1 Tax=Streptomyces sp. NBC_00893 TaxID=2975862 RepID=UPI00225AEC3B|nr:AAA family ATPase [Streptomyces sp. NBC_00893]MCX4851458.1 chloramphenicol phosphotransferase CPT family protein [Streptomyces sp. NBC_00893]
MHRNPQAAEGLIIFLNGTSSSGKSSIARELVAVLGEPCFHMPVDAFHAMRSTPEMPPDQLNVTLKRTWMGFHRAVAGMAAARNTVVVDQGVPPQADDTHRVRTHAPMRSGFSA